MKTVHPAVHGGILARRDKPQHLEELARHGLQTIDLVACNLYPFVETVGRLGAMPPLSSGGEGIPPELEEALENIDIGGPAMIRAAAKNFPAVLVVVDPDDYGPVLERLREGNVPLEERRRLAEKSFQHVALYDTAIARYLSLPLKAGLRGESEAFPEAVTVGLRKLFDLRYGENPHQWGAF